MKKENVTISNPSELNKHLQHSSPLTWLTLGVTAAIIVAFFAWAAIFKLKVKISGMANVHSGEATLIVNDSSLSELKAGQTVYISNQEGLLSFNDDNKPIVSNLTLNDGDYSYYIVVKEVRPIDFLFGK